MISVGSAFPLSVDDVTVGLSIELKLCKNESNNYTENVAIEENGCIMF